MGPPKRAIIHHQSRAGWVKKQTQYTEKGNTNWHASEDPSLARSGKPFSMQGAVMHFPIWSCVEQSAKPLVLHAAERLQPHRPAMSCGNSWSIQHACWTQLPTTAKGPAWGQLACSSLWSSAYWTVSETWDHTTPTNRVEPGLHPIPAETICCYWAARRVMPRHMGDNPAACQRVVDILNGYFWDLNGRILEVPTIYRACVRAMQGNIHTKYCLMWYSWQYLHFWVVWVQMSIATVYSRRGRSWPMQHRTVQSWNPKWQCWMNAGSVTGPAQQIREWKQFAADFSEQHCARFRLHSPSVFKRAHAKKTKTCELIHADVIPCLWRTEGICCYLS